MKTYWMKHRHNCGTLKSGYLFRVYSLNHHAVKDCASTFGHYRDGKLTPDALHFVGFLDNCVALGGGAGYMNEIGHGCFIITLQGNGQGCLCTVGLRQIQKSNRYRIRTLCKKRV